MFSTSAWTAITSLGASELMLPAAAMVSVQLLAARAWRSALVWALCFALAVCVVLVSKLAFLGWGIGIQPIDFTGISGHATLATAVLPVVACLLIPRKWRFLHALGITCGFALGLAVGLSRCVLGMHSPAEVVAGLVLGGFVAGVVIGKARTRPVSGANPWALPALLSLIVINHYAYARAIGTHDLVVTMALQASGREQPFTRKELHVRSTDSIAD